jgi:hypothetical protein
MKHHNLIAVTPLMLIAFVVGCASPNEPALSGASSTNGKYVARMSYYGNHPEEKRILEIVSRDNGSPIFECVVERNVKFSWSPDGDAVSLVDNFASNENRVHVVDLSQGQTILLISRENAHIQASTVPAPVNYSHVYFSDIKWIGRNKIRLAIEMYNSLSAEVPNSYSGSYDVELSRR